MTIPGNLLSASTESMDPTISGWKTRNPNTTLGRGTAGRVGGPTSLYTKSKAAGEMQATTVSSYPCTGGETYYTFADAAGVDQPPRIGIEWISVTGATLSITWSVYTSSAVATWHRVSVAGVAPAGTAAMRPVLSSTATAIDKNNFWENVYLGLPLRTSGNLLSFKSEQPGELDLSTFAAEANCALSKTAPPTMWSADYYNGGGHMLTLTATAAGNMRAACTERAPVTPGADYLAYLYLQPPTTAATSWVELRFYTAAGALIAGSPRAYLAPPSLSTYRQRVSGVAPATAATASLAVGTDSAASGAVLRADQFLLRAATPLVDGSVLPYADASFEHGAAGWTISSGSATIARSTPWASDAIDGNYMLSASSGVGVSVLRSAAFPVVGGKNWRPRISMRTAAGSWEIDGSVRYYNASGTDLGAVGLPGYFAIPATGWWYNQADGLAPATAVTGRVEWKLKANAAGSVLQLDAASLRQVVAATTVTAVQATASVTMTLRELTAGTLISVWRVGGDGIRTLVRGPQGLYDKTPVTSDVLVIEDYEAPLGVPVSYHYETYTSAGALDFTRDSLSVTLDPGDTNEAWLKDPANPQRNLRVLIERAPDWSRPIEQAEYRVRGRRNSVVLSEVRAGLEGELALWTRTDDERRGLHWLLDSGGVLLWQAAPGMGVDDMYVSVAEVSEARLSGYAPEPWRAWSLALREADMPTAIGVNGSAGRTWQDVLVEHATWEELMTSYATWEDVLLNRRLEG